MSLIASFGLVISVFSGPSGTDYTSLKELADFVSYGEKLGFKTIWHTERLLPAALPVYSSSTYDTLVTLGAIIHATRKSRLGTSIFNISYRNPVLVAKQFATLDVLSEGRVMLGLGRGWFQKEFESLNVPMEERGERFDESLSVIKRLLTEKEVTHKGKFWTLNKVRLHPRPIQKPRPPILLGGGGPFTARDRVSISEERVLKKVADEGDGWICRTGLDPETVARYVRMLRKYLSERGANSELYPLTHQTFIVLEGKSGSENNVRKRLARFSGLNFDEAKKRYIIGTSAEVQERIKKIIEAGINHFMVWPFGIDYDLIEFIAREVIPSYEPLADDVFKVRNEV